MKLWTELGIAGRHSHLRWDAGAYDGIPPVGAVQINARFRSLNRDREAVALALVYHGFLSGPLEFGNSCSPSVAAEIESFFCPRQVPVSTVDLVPRALPMGTRTSLLGKDITCRAEPDAIYDVRMDFVNDQTFGSSLSARLLAIACNVGSLYGHDNDAAILARIGIAILLAEDYSVRSIIVHVSSGFLHNAAYDIEKLQSLSGAVNVRLHFDYFDEPLPIISADRSDRFLLCESPHQAQRQLAKRKLEILG